MKPTLKCMANACFTGLLPQNVLSQSPYKDFGGRRLTVVQPSANPFAKLYIYPDGSTLRTGADHEALKYLASALNFNFKVVGSVDGEWGGMVDKARNAFNGMIGMVQRKERRNSNYTNCFSKLSCGTGGTLGHGLDHAHWTPRNRCRLLLSLLCD